MTAPDPAHDAEPTVRWTPRRLALLALTALALWLCWLVARPFVASLTWATALAVVAWPLQRRFVRYLRRPGLAALLTCSVVFIAIGVPATVLVPRIVEQGAIAVDLGRDWIASDEPVALLERQAWLQPALRWAQENLSMGDLVQRAGDVVANTGRAAVQASLDGALQLVLTFFVLFYFLRDRDDVLASIASLVPLSRGEARTLIREIGDTLHATLVGKVLVSLLQGALGGAMFFALGVPAALFWSVVMAVAAFVPLLGTPLVWAPAALWLLIDGSWIKATVLVAWGTAVVGMADNLLYPMMVGNRVRLHTVPMLLSMVGGLFVFGMAGFFVGPVVLAATLTLLRIWAARGEGADGPPGPARAGAHRRADAGGDTARDADRAVPVSSLASARTGSAAPPR